MKSGLQKGHTMCQAAPLPRCSNHALKAKADIEQTIDRNNEKTLALSRELVEAKRQARYAKFTDEQIMAGDTPGLEHIQKIREAHAAIEREQMSLGRDIAEQELHLDATPKGRKALEEDENAAYRGFRLKNVRALNDWHKSIRDTTDSKGVRITDKDADPKARREFLGKELVKAREDYNNAIAAHKFADEKREKINEEAFKHEVRTVGLNDPQGRRFGTWIAKDGASKDEQEEVEYLSRQKSSAMTGLQQAHHDQILARAKVNSIRKALQDEKNREAKAAKKNATAKQEQEFLARRRADNRVKAEAAVADMKDTRLRMMNYAKGYKGTMNEELRISAKASTVSDSTRLLDTYRDLSHGDDAKAVKEFRTEIKRRKDDAEKEADTAKASGNLTDEAMYRGAQSGFSLVLDKVREL
jgi:hypothetical protein